MQRLTISVDDALAVQFEYWLREKGYANRSEAFRDLVRNALEAERLQSGAATHCVACLSFVFNHRERQLAGRIADLQQAAHDVTVSTMHVHLDHAACLETTLLRGSTAAVTALAKAITAQTGVRHGQLNLIPVEISTDGHDHSRNAHPHHHLHPNT